MLLGKGSLGRLPEGGDTVVEPTLNKGRGAFLQASRAFSNLSPHPFPESSVELLKLRGSEVSKWVSEHTNQW